MSPLIPFWRPPASTSCPSPSPLTRGQQSPVTSTAERDELGGTWVRPRSLTAIFAVTGFAALSLQVAWHRILALHSGVDLGSTTTVVVAFLAGLGLGNLLGGRLADILEPRRSLAALAVAEAATAGFAWISVGLLRSVPPAITINTGGLAADFAAYAIVLLFPTVLMGLSIPLAARTITAHPVEAGPLIGRIYGVNTLGAALGAVVTGWFLLGTYGTLVATRIASFLSLLAAIAFLALWWRSPVPDMATANAGPDGAATSRRTSGANAPDSKVASLGRPGGVWPWLIIYGVTGAVALGLQQVFFRIVDTATRSNSYSFSLVLGLYLACFGLGAALGGRVAGRVANPRRAFLQVQIAVGIGAALPIILLVRGFPLVGFDPGLKEWFSGTGFRAGFGDFRIGSSLMTILRFGLLLPLAVLGPAAALMGVAFPIAERIVADDLARLGRRTGALLAANLVGNVGGALLTTFVLIDLFGTAQTLRLLVAVLVVGGLAGLVVLGATPLRGIAWVGAVAVAALVLLPNSPQLWATLQAVEPTEIDIAEDRSCVSAVTATEGGASMLVLNGAAQNGHPFDDFHVLIGLLPALSHPDPQRALAVGLGIGSTTYGLLRNPGMQEVITAELCGGNQELIERLAPGRPEFAGLIGDHRHRLLVSDGRTVLEKNDQSFDLVIVDTLLPESGFSGNTYSREFYELVSKRLGSDGIFAQWVPTERVLRTASQVFPHLVTVQVDSYSSTFMLAGPTALELDPQTLLHRFDSFASAGFAADQRRRLRAFLASPNPTCVRRGSPPPASPPEAVNTDLHPRDEYFLNNRRQPDPAADQSGAGACALP
jgi:spermidine synthase